MSLLSCAQSLTLATSAAAPGAGGSVPAASAAPAGGAGGGGAGGVSFRELLLHRGVPADLAQYLLGSFQQPPPPPTPSDGGPWGPAAGAAALPHASLRVALPDSALVSPQGSAPPTTATPGAALGTSPAAGGAAAAAAATDVPSLPPTPPGGALLRAMSPAGGGGAAGPATGRSTAGAGGSAAPTPTVHMPEELVGWCIPAGTPAFKQVRPHTHPPSHLGWARDDARKPHAPALGLRQVRGRMANALNVQVLTRPGVVASLKLLVSMAQGHPGIAQQAAGATLPSPSPLLPATPSPSPARPLLPLLHLLEGVAGGPVVGPLAEGLLDALAAAAGAASDLAAAVAELRTATQRRAKELAARRRQAMLSAMGVSPASAAAAAPPSGSTPAASGAPWDAAATPSNPRSPALGAGGPSGAGGSLWSTPPSVAGTPEQPGGSYISPGTRPVATATPGAGPSAPATQTTGFQPNTAGGGGAGSSTPRPSPMVLPSPAGSQLAMELAALEAEEAAQEQALAGDGADAPAAELRCMVCREGYRLRPKELLCVYVYSKPVFASPASSAAAAAAGGDGPAQLPVGGTARMLLPDGSPCGAAYCSVTHFNVIHASCHAAARAADAALRQPKREWDGATLRNGEVRPSTRAPRFSPDGLRAAGKRGPPWLGSELEVRTLACHRGRSC